MYSLSNLFKLNDLKTKHENFEELSVERLETYLRKYEKLTSDTKLLESLSDKGEKLKSQLKTIQDLMNQKRKNETKNEDDKTLENVETSEATTKVLEDIQNKVQSLKVDPENGTTQKPTSTNYFATVSEKTNTAIDTKKLEQVKQKILANNEKRYKCQSTKEIPVDECFKIVVEHEKRVKEIQMKQAAEKLLQGSSNSYNYNMSGDQSKYRESRANRVYDDDEERDDASDDSDQYDDGYEDQDKLNRVFKSNVDRNRYKNSKEDELEKLD